MFCRNCGAALADESHFCESCGTPTKVGRVVVRESPSPSGTEQTGKARTGARIPPEALIIGALIVLLLLLLWGLSNNESPTPSTTAQNSPATTAQSETAAKSEAPSTEGTPQRDSPIPQLQQSFISMIDSFIPKYNSAGSGVLAANDDFRQVEQEHRKTNVRVERKEAIANYFSASGRLRFQEWSGEVADTFPYEDLDGTESAYLAVKLTGTDILLKTAGGSKVLDAMILEKAVENNQADLFSPSPNTMISRNDVLYRSLMNIKKGDEVVVSGIFLLKNNGDDYLYEASLTEKGSMTNPEFFVKFTQISKKSDQVPQSSPVLQSQQDSERSAATPLPNEAPDQSAVSSPPATGVPHNDWHVVSIDTRLAETGDLATTRFFAAEVVPMYVWKLKIRNNSDEPATFSGQIDFKDAQGVIVQSDTFKDYASIGCSTCTDNAVAMRVPGKSEAVFTGYAPAGARKAVRTVANVCPFLLVRVQLPPFDTSKVGCEHFEEQITA
jgi:hypothetical protein